MLIAYEGCSGVGKTTLVKQLAAAGCDVYNGQADRPRTHTQETAAAYTAANDFGALAYALARSHDVHTDRFGVTHAVNSFLRAPRERTLSWQLTNTFEWVDAALHFASKSYEALLGARPDSVHRYPFVRIVFLREPIAEVRARRERSGKLYAFYLEEEYAVYDEAACWMRRNADYYPWLEVL